MSEYEGDPPATERRRSIFHVKSVQFKSEIRGYEKSAEENRLISKALQSNDFLKNILTERTQNLMVHLMTHLAVKEGEIIISQDEIGEFMYVSQSGSYQVLKNGREVQRFQENTVFGEVAIIYNHKRHATVKAVTDGKLWVIHKEDYSSIMIRNAKEQEAEVLEFLKKVPVLCEAPELKLQQAVGLFTKRAFSSDTKIVEEGQEGKDFYIITAGTAKVLKKGAPGCLTTLSRGQYFGEQALLKGHGLRQATVEAESPVVECLVLHYSHFVNLFGGVKEFLQSAPTAVETDSPVGPPIARKKYASIKLHDLKIRTTIGIGGYGRVELSHLKTNYKKLFALKYMSRHRILGNNLTKYVQREKEIQIRCQNPFIVELYKTYNDRRYVYLLQEYCPGGDLLSLLQRSRAHCCTEKESKFLVACVFEAIGYLHDKSFIFRDIKPENLVLDRNGYVKLTDFGCARKLELGFRTYSMHGAPEYIPPEFIYQRGYDRAVDLWASGCLLFEVLVGHTPFKTNDPSYMQTYNLIVKGIDCVKFPSKVSKLTSGLIKNLCNANPQLRLGYCTGVEEIRNHKWFQGFDWVKLRNHQMPSPFVIKLSSDVDTKYFDRFRPEAELAPMDETSLLDNF